MKTLTILADSTAGTRGFKAAAAVVDLSLTLIQTRCAERTVPRACDARRATLRSHTCSPPSRPARAAPPRRSVEQSAVTWQRGKAARGAVGARAHARTHHTDPPTTGGFIFGGLGRSRARASSPFSPKLRLITPRRQRGTHPLRPLYSVTQSNPTAPVPSLRRAHAADSRSVHPPPHVRSARCAGPVWRTAQRIGFT
jgi:hypothetical protein